MENSEFARKKQIYIIIMASLAVVLLVLVVIVGVNSEGGLVPVESESVSAAEIVSSELSSAGSNAESAAVHAEESSASSSPASQAEYSAELSEAFSEEISASLSEEDSSSQAQPPVTSEEESACEPISQAVSAVEESREEVTWEPYSIKTSGRSANGKSFPASYAEKNVTAQYVAVYNVTKGEFIYTKNGGAKAYPASMTKLITAMLAERYLPADEKITVGKEIELVKPHSSLAYLYDGLTIPLETALDAMLLPSGNDAAYVMAVNVGRKLLGDENASFESCLQAFCEEANRFVRSIGCKHTNITCPDGFHDPDHYSTAGDFALISAEVVKNYPLVKKVCAKKQAKDDSRLKWTNTNNLLSDISCVNGLKTGSTNEAGYCVAVSAHAEDTDIVIIIMNCKTTGNRTSDAKVLINSAFGWY